MAMGVNVVDVAVGVIVVNMVVGIINVVVEWWWWWEESGVAWLSPEQLHLEAAARGLPDVLNMPSIPLL
jgi:hypothetical protein